MNERTGKVVYRFKRPFRDGSTHVALDPMSFLSRLAALVPPPRMHLVTYYGVLAPSAKRREQIVPVTLPSRKQKPRFSPLRSGPHRAGKAGLYFLSACSEWTLFL